MTGSAPAISSVADTARRSAKPSTRPPPRLPGAQDLLDDTGARPNQRPVRIEVPREVSDIHVGRGGRGVRDGDVERRHPFEDLALPHGADNTKIRDGGARRSYRGIRWFETGRRRVTRPPIAQQSILPGINGRLNESPVDIQGTIGPAGPRYPGEKDHV
jgi:hypothetical protein